MKNLILLLSVMMIAGIATARRPRHGSGKEKRYNCEKHESCGESLEKHERRRNRHKKHKGDGSGERKLTQEQREQRLRRITKGDEAEYNRLLQLSKDDPKAFRKEMRARRAQRKKNKNFKNKGDLK